MVCCSPEYASPPRRSGCADVRQAECGFQTGAGAILDIFKPKPENSVCVFGLGGVGLTALMAVKAVGVRQTVAVDVQSSRLELARELGTADTINPKDTQDVVSEIKRVTGGGAAYALECTGVMQRLEQSLECLRPLGTAGLICVPLPGAKLSVDSMAFLMESKRFHGLIEGDSVLAEFIPKLQSRFQEICPVE